MSALEHRVTQSGRVVAAPGDLIVVAVQENPTTGYTWRVEAQGPVVLESDSATEPAPPQAPGAGRLRELRARVTGRGTSRLVLSLSRPWEAEPIDSLVVDVDA